MKHFVFTRWNLLSADVSIYNNPAIKDPEAWMEHRMLFFEKYTLPSMLAQTDKDFIWLLAFDEQTPYDIIRRYDYYDNIKIIFQYPKDWLVNEVYDEWIITTRLDNDDYVYPTFIENIKSYFDKEEMVIDVEYVQYDHYTGKHYTSNRRPPNGPFLSLAEYVRDTPKTCYYCSHSKMAECFPAIKIPKILAKMIIHDRNISNHIVGREINV